MNDIEVIYIIEETELNKITFRIIQHSSGKIRDVDIKYIEKYNMDISKAKRIIVKSIEKYSGRLQVGLNDFETYCRLHDMQHILNEYDTSKNTKRVNEISKGCIDKVWWKCSNCRHEWQAFIKARTALNSGCPICRHKDGKYHMLVSGSNDLLTWCKENDRLDIISEYSTKNKLRPNEISAKSHDKVILVCSRCNKEYTQILANKTDKGQGCPNCSKNGTSFPERFIYEFISKYIDNVEYRHKVYGIEVDVYLTNINMAIDYRGKYWHTNRNEIDKYKETLLDNMNIRQLIIIGDRQADNCVLDTKHIVFDEKDYTWLANELIKICKLDNKSISTNSIDALVKEVTVKQNSKEVINSLVDTHPNVAARWDYKLNGEFKPNNITYGTKYKAWFVCDTCGKSYYSSIRKQAIGQGCPYCYAEGRTNNQTKKIKNKSLPKLKQYGDWTIIEKVKDRRYLCRCICGELKEFSDSSLYFIKKTGYKCQHKEKDKKQYILSSNSSYTQIFLNDIESILKNNIDYTIKDNEVHITHKNIIVEFVSNTNKKDRLYNQNKTIACARKGIQLIHIFDYEWGDPVKRIKLTNYLNSFINKNEIYYARDLEVQEIDNKDAKDFQDQYHLQNSVNSECNIAMTKDNKIISVMSFSKPRFNHDYEWEITRYCNKSGVNVVGGAERIFKHFINDNNPISILTYVDISKFTGNVYTKLGFKPTQDCFTVPNYVWVDNHLTSVLPRYKTQKRKLVENGLGTIDQTEDEIMTNLEYTKVYDSGNLRLEWIQT